MKNTRVIFHTERTDHFIAYESGIAVAYGLFNAQDRGSLFISPGEEVYAGMIVGENPRTEEIEVNVCKTKHLTNTRAASADDALRLVPPKKSSALSRHWTSSTQTSFSRLHLII